MRAVGVRRPLLANRRPWSPRVLSRALGDPAPPGHDFQCSGQGCAVHREHFAQMALGYFSGEREKLQDRELSGAQAKRAKGQVIELCEGPRGAAEVATHTWQNWQVVLAHARQMHIHVLWLQRIRPSRVCGSRAANRRSKKKESTSISAFGPPKGSTDQRV